MKPAARGRSKGDDALKSPKGKKKPAAAAAGADKKAGGKKKKNVVEIDGVLWLLDDNGNKVKKVRKKGADGSPAAKSRSISPNKGGPGGGAASVGGGGAAGKKKNIAEIDGQLYLLDANGQPMKKLRKKNEKPERSKSLGPGAARAAALAAAGPATGDGGGPRRRSKSLGPGSSLEVDIAAMLATPLAGEDTTPGVRQEYTDHKGRKVIIEEDGSKTVIDKNGKRLRPKNSKRIERAKPSAAPTSSKQQQPDIESSGDDFMDGSIHEGKDMFDSLWNDDGATVMGGGGGAGKSSKPMKMLGDISEGNNHGDGDDHKNKESSKEESRSLSAQISEYGKENRELQLKVSSAQEEIEDLKDQIKKEKAKNVKAMTEMMQLKADFTEASSELQRLRTKVKDLSATIDEKEQHILQLQSANAASAGLQNHHHHNQDEEKKNERMDDGGFGGSRGGGLGGGGARCTACGAPNKEVDELFAENRALQRKMEFEKGTWALEMKKREDRINFLSKESSTLREELELILTGEKGDTPGNPIMARLIKERKAMEEKYIQEKEVNTVRTDAMQEMIETLQNHNKELRQTLKDNDFTVSDSSLDVTDFMKEGLLKIEQNRTQPPIEEDLNASRSGWGFFGRK